MFGGHNGSYQKITKTNLIPQFHGLEPGSWVIREKKMSLALSQPQAASFNFCVEIPSPHLLPFCLASTQGLKLTSFEFESLEYSPSCRF